MEPARTMPLKYDNPVAFVLRLYDLILHNAREKIRIRDDRTNLKQRMKIRELQNARKLDCEQPETHLLNESAVKRHGTLTLNSWREFLIKG